MSTSENDHSEECFFIAPIGSEGSDERKRSDGIFEFIVAPAAKELGLKAVRADHIGQPGIITTQVIAHVLESKAAVVDLSGLNPNVFYELAIRHTAQRPAALIAETDCTLPFDIAQMRTIFFDHTDLKSASDCKLKIIEQLREGVEKGATDSPIGAAIDIQGLQAGSAIERMVADLVEKTEVLSRSQMKIEDMMAMFIDKERFIERRRDCPVSLWEDVFSSLSRLQEAILLTCKAERADGMGLIEAYDRLVRPLEFMYHEAGIEKDMRLPPSKFRRLFSSDRLINQLKIINESEE